MPKEFAKNKGTRDEVYLGIAKRTAGGLTADMLIKNKRGKIVSKKRSEQSRANSDRLKKWQFTKKDMNTPSEK